MAIARDCFGRYRATLGRKATHPTGVLFFQSVYLYYKRVTTTTTRPFYLQGVVNALRVRWNILHSGVNDVKSCEGAFVKNDGKNEWCYTGRPGKRVDARAILEIK
jgi:hypothetical protein